MIEVSPQDQERIEQILAVRCPDATSLLDLDADGVDLMTTRLGDVYDAVLCVGPAFAALSNRDELQAAFRTFAAHSRPGTQLIVRRPALVHQAAEIFRSSATAST
ncbi:MAG: hypothetical protein AUG49_15280 [Catenulispora sp. 13_1_20CM_3_70_7]|nr:MAG: hypothetical protein AUG49_15280 [Catenulispora sp. 13_1_20CM_3_70_7]